jgi:RND family efflux transporter MFP subunit
MKRAMLHRFAHGMNMTRLFLTLPLAALMLTACNHAPPADDERRAVSIERIGNGRAGNEIAYPGEIRSAFESQLGFQVSGVIVERLVDVGDTVRAGQPLFRIDAGDYSRALDSAAAQTSAAQTAAATQQADLARSRELLDQGFISPAEFAQQKSAAAQAQAQLRAANAQRGTAAAQVSRTVLTAPRAGIVTQLQGEAGQIVAAGQTVLTLADPGRPEIAVSLPEGGLGPIEHARRLSVTLWSDPGRRYEAKLHSIAGAADPATRTFAARVTILAPEADLRIGQTAELHVETDGSPASILVPLTAVGQHEGRAQAWVLDRKTMTVRPQPVKIGAARGEQLVVLAGLEPGDTVVTAGIHLLRAGEKVRIAQVPAS